MAKNKIFFAVDADVLRALAKMDELLKVDPNYDFRKSTNKLINKSSGYLFNMLNLIKSKKLNLFVGNTIFHEVKHKSECIDFIKQYCYLTNFNSTNFEEKLKKADDLAYKYCYKTIVKDGVTHYPPMHPIYNSYSRKNTPSNDAYAMAEATIAGCLFITANGKDFVFNSNSSNNITRTLGIIDINVAEGYSQPTEMGYSVPRPMLLKVFGPLIRDGLDNFVATTAVESEMVHGSVILQ